MNVLPLEALTPKKLLELPIDGRQLLQFFLPDDQ